jgi:predicted Zn-dependent protease
MKKLALILILLFILSCSAKNREEFSALSSSILGAAGLNVSSSTVSSALDLGESVNRASRGLSDEQEYYLGRAVSAMVVSQYNLDFNTAKLRYLNQVGRVVAAASPRPETFAGYYFGLLKSSEKNAVSAPGGFIFVSEGMLSEIKSEDELAAVLAHEVAHVVLGHGVAAISQSNLTSALSAAGKEALSYSNNMVTQTLSTSFGDSAKEVFDTLITKGYSRSQEYESDLLALSILEKAGYQPQALLTVLQALESNSESEGGWYETHPKASARLEEAKDNLKVKEANLNDPAYLSRKARFSAVF